MTRKDAGSRIIVALDVDNVRKATKLVTLLKGEVGGFKIGFEFIYSMLATLVTANFGDAHAALNELRMLFEAFDHSEFLDGKIADIPNTIAGAVRAICQLQPMMFNMHAFAGSKAMLEARKTLSEVFSKIGMGERPLLLAVTLLTSIDEDGLVELGLKPEDATTPYRTDLVTRYAKLAHDRDCDGVIASPLEVEAIRQACGKNFLIYTPGVRLPGSAKHDQKNVATPGYSIHNGTTGVIIGRDITGAEDPAAAVELVIDNILQNTNADEILTEAM